MTESSEKPMPCWTMTMTEEQAQEVYRACELAARIRMGQFDDLRRILTPKGLSSDESDRFYQVITRLFDLVKLAAFPDMPLSLTGINRNMETQRLFDIAVAIRNSIARNRDALVGETDHMVLIMVSRDDPKWRMQSDWPMVDMVYSPAREVSRAERVSKKTCYVIRRVGTDSYYAEKSFGDGYYASLDDAYLFDNDKDIDLDADEELVAVTKITRIEVHKGVANADGGASTADS